jgi:hypothetical protein
VRRFSQIYQRISESRVPVKQVNSLNGYTGGKTKKEGTAPVLIPARLLRQSIKVILVNNGWIKYHRG